jgi:MinD superfamily P-loop ATPase
MELESMKQLAVVSGKGGTGKTSLTAALAHLAHSNGYANSLVIVDADVDAANLELVLAPQRLESEEFSGGKIAAINPDRCAGCADCVPHCRFDAITETDGQLVVDPLACEGCGVCALICPNNAVQLEPHSSGWLYRSSSLYGPMVHAQLHPAQENSGKLVSQVRQKARQIAQSTEKRLVLIDGPPGIGCPVIAALTGIDLALIVTEPTLSGLHDLGRIAGLTNHFGLSALVLVNKADLNPDGAESIERMCTELGLNFIGSIPYDPNLPASMSAAEPVTQYFPKSPASQSIQRLWRKISSELDRNQR